VARDAKRPFGDGLQPGVHRHHCVAPRVLPLLPGDRLDATTPLLVAFFA